LLILYRISTYTSVKIEFSCKNIIMKNNLLKWSCLLPAEVWQVHIKYKFISNSDWAKLIVKTIYFQHKTEAKVYTLYRNISEKLFFSLFCLSINIFYVFSKYRGTTFGEIFELKKKLYWSCRRSKILSSAKILVPSRDKNKFENFLKSGLPIFETNQLMWKCSCVKNMPKNRVKGKM
jgi:hypothetical protein